MEVEEPMRFKRGPGRPGSNPEPNAGGWLRLPRARSTRAAQAGTTAMAGAEQHRLLIRYMWASLGAAVATIALKVFAAVITGSVGFLSDAMESGVNLVAATVGLGALTVAARPPDTVHHFGHGKAEYLSAAVEGLLVLVAAGAILWTSIQRLLHPMDLEQAGWGLALSTGASLINLGVGLMLVRAGRRHRSMALVADGRHLLTDVWTSAGVLVGITLVVVFGWQPLDPIVALLVGANIVYIGYDLLRRSLSGLLDAALPAADVARVVAVLDHHRNTSGVVIDAPRTREAGRQRFVYVKVVVPGDWTVARSHKLADTLEGDIEAVLPGTATFVHIEPDTGAVPAGS
jgi:cation diffusion facilitator family transporter